MKQYRSAITLAVFCNLLWSFSYVFQKQCAAILSPDAVVAWRFLLAALSLLPILVISGIRLLLSHRDLGRAIAIGILCYTLAPMMQVAGIHHSRAGSAGILIVAEPVFSILLACLLLGEAFTLRTGLSLLCVLGGVLTLSGATSSGLASETLMANFLILGSVLTEALQGPMSKGPLQRCHPFVLAFYSFLSGGAVALVIGLVRGTKFYPPEFPLAPVLCLAILCTTIAYSLWYAVLKRMPVSRAVLFIYLQPAAASLFAYLVLGEALRTLDLLALLLILGGILLGSAKE